MNIQEATPISLTEEERAVLEGMVRSAKTERGLSERARMVLLAAQGRSTRPIAEELGTWPSLRRAPRFDRLCFSSSIIRWNVADLPEVPFTQQRVPLRRYLDVGHARWADLARADGRPLKPVPFPGAVYVVNTGENQSFATHNIGWRRRLLRQLTPGRPVSAASRHEFSIPPDVGGAAHRPSPPETSAAAQ
jgi:hypothetical protein